ncbi:stage II sporulation protein M [Capnocytophaga stomatis]|uniref:stage II sporulation protein M n=1 Tax=Capnocytophaga stomatis TaxID=1848904 RepID=UPI001AC2333A|nr:stage II sporulation protein M [Capnocytophaga stomatis]GIM49625.1 hypothetical protein CAPN003_10770 [Capnocytophaga stomatis]
MKLKILTVLTFFLPFVVGLFLIEVNDVPIKEESNPSFLVLDKVDLLFKILTNNTYVILINVLGFLSFGGITLLNTSYNGFVLGLFFNTIKQKTNLSLIFSSFLPHSIELVAILLSCYIGYCLSIKLYHYIFKEVMEFNFKDIKKILFCLIIVFISSLLEVFVSIR